MWLISVTLWPCLKHFVSLLPNFPHAYTLYATSQNPPSVHSHHNLFRPGPIISHL